MLTDEADLELNFAHTYDEAKFADIAEDLRAGGANVVLKRRTPEGGYAFLEWLILTGLVVYVKKFAEKSGELHAEALHKGLSRLWHKVFDAKPEITYGFVGSKGFLEPQVFTPAVSVKARRVDGGEATLMFPLNTSEQDFNLGSERFIDLVRKHHELAGADGLTEAMARVPYLESPGFQVLVYMNPETQELELIDYVESSQAGILIAYPIPNQGKATRTAR